MYFNLKFQVKSPIQNIIQVPEKLLWMRWDRISYSKVAWSAELGPCNVRSSTDFLFSNILTFQNYVVVVCNRTMNDIVSQSGNSRANRTAKLGNSRVQSYIRTGSIGPIQKWVVWLTLSKRASKTLADIIEPHDPSMYTLSMLPIHSDI